MITNGRYVTMITNIDYSTDADGLHIMVGADWLSDEVLKVK